MNRPLDIAKIRADIHMLMDDTMRGRAEAERWRRAARWDPLIAVVACLAIAVVAHLFTR